MIQTPGGNHDTPAVAGRRLDFQAVLDGLTQGVLVFDQANQLAYANAAAREMFAGDLKLIRQEGWAAASVLFSTRSRSGQTLDEARAEAMNTGRPVAFQTFRAAEYVPASVSAILDRRGEVYTLLMVDWPDWSALSELLDRFLIETREAVDSTGGHAALIEQILANAKPDENLDKLRKRIGGFTHLINIHMLRTQRLLELMERLEDVRLGKARDKIAAETERLKLDEFIHDLLDNLDHTHLLDPETEPYDVRERIALHIPPNLFVEAAPRYLAGILRDILRNAMMYSDPALPVGITAQRAGGGAHLRIMDEGPGIRTSENERVFLPFQRARQPQVIAEFGYGLCLFLCKHEVEAMNGRIWYESEEGAGTTFSLKLPLWHTPEPVIAAALSSSQT